MGYYIHLQTQFVTALDIWILLCMLFVATATFEYAMLLIIRYRKPMDKGKTGDMYDMMEETIRKVDRCALRAFVAIYVLTDSVYFFIVHSKFML